MKRWLWLIAVPGTVIALVNVASGHTDVFDLVALSSVAVYAFSALIADALS